MLTLNLRHSLAPLPTVSFQQLILAHPISYHRSYSHIKSATARTSAMEAEEVVSALLVIGLIYALARWLTRSSTSTPISLPAPPQGLLALSINMGQPPGS